MRDIWNRLNLGASPHAFKTTLLGHGSRLLKVRPVGRAHETYSQSYEAEAAELSGVASIFSCSACSDGAEVGYIGGSTMTNTVTFNNVFVEKSGVYRMEVGAMTQGPRAFVYTVNGGAPATLNMGDGSFNLPQATIVPIVLATGVNTITFGNPATYAPNLDRIVISGSSLPTNQDGYAPGLDSITVAPVVNMSSLSGAITGKTGSDTVRLWKFTLSNNGVATAHYTLVNSFTVASNDSSSGCKAVAVLHTPFRLGDITVSASRTIEVPIAVSPDCDNSSTF